MVDIAVQAMVGAAQTGKLVDALANGDKVDANDVSFAGNFPYVALPSRDKTAPAATSTSPNGIAPAASQQGDDGMSWTPIAASGVGAAALVGGGGWLLMRRRRVG